MLVEFGFVTANEILFEIAPDGNCAHSTQLPTVAGTLVKLPDVVQFPFPFVVPKFVAHDCGPLLLITQREKLVLAN